MRKIKSSRKKKISLTTLLSGLVLLSVLLTLVIVLIPSYHLKKQALYETTLSLNLTNATKMSETMDTLFKSMRSNLHYSAGVVSNRAAMNEDEIRNMLELNRQSSNYFNSIIMVDETGIIRGRAPQSDGSVGKVVSSSEAKEALASRRPYLSKPYVSPSGRFMVFISEPIYDKNGSYRGFIGGSIYLQENNILNMIFGKNDITDQGGYFYVVGPDGRLLFHPDKSRLGEDISANTVVQKLLQGKSGHEEVVNLKGVPLLAGYSFVPENRWGIVVVSPIETVYEQLNYQIKATLLYTLLPFLLLMLAAVWLARRLAHPFVSLANFARKFGRDDAALPESKHHWNREADLLNKTILLAFSEMKKKTDQLTLAAMTDPLTGLWNRRTLETIIGEWIAEKTAFSIVVMDVDDFKSINDIYGHHAGDEVLKRVAEDISSSVRPGDACCRFGGEEFVALLALAEEADAFKVAERIRGKLEASEFPHEQPVTISLGIAHYPSHGDSAEALFQQADQALYKAKGAGRNRTVIAE